MPNFLELVAKERARQINDEGYTSINDDLYDDGSLANAAAAYAATIPVFRYRKHSQSSNEEYLTCLFPWNPNYLKKDKHPRKKQLIIAASLLMAEYDRLEREEKKDTRCRGCHSLKGIKPDTWCGELGVPMNEDDTRCESYNLPPFEASEDNPILKSFMRSSRE
ncbi:MAG: hypothetical protein Q8M43_01260 [Sulfuricurvum sp.]|uniref:hypothetical protein n=1 Tax=Sulfuricurvum sp. TaxID=2025608 RepID=UPI002735595D|nr:hypothetical protein [Sulfuricurvum sp.]MDP3290640.1 hypothetical protein [Sulfuricurvum sp.]